MDANSTFPIYGLTDVACFEVTYNLLRASGNIRAWSEETANGEVGVSDGLDTFTVMSGRDIIKVCVNIIQL